MLKNNIQLLKKSNRNYLLDNKFEVSKEILKYIESRIIADRKEIEELIKLTKEDITFEQIVRLFEADNEIYKNYRNFVINNNFLSVEIDMPVGVIAVECYDTIEVIKYFIQAITTRNAIVISDVEYSEYNIKSLILLIMQEVLKKFEIDENLIMILPYEECYYEYFDEVIYTYNTEGTLLEEPKIERKGFGAKNFVYIHSQNLKDEALKNENAEILEGDFEEVINQIGKENSAVIYTEDNEIAYKFINLVNCKNVFVNTNLVNQKEFEGTANIFYETKHIIIPIPKKEEKVIVQDEEQKSSEIEEKDNKTENLDLIVKEENIFTKIKNILKSFFRKKIDNFEKLKKQKRGIYEN